MPDIQHLLKTKQFSSAVRKILDSRLPGVTTDDEIVAKVTVVVVAALKAYSSSELRSIVRKYGRWVDPETTELIAAHLLETTEVENVMDVDDTDILRA